MSGIGLLLERQRAAMVFVWATWLPSAALNGLSLLPICDQEEGPGATALGRRVRSFEASAGGTYLGCS